MKTACTAVLHRERGEPDRTLRHHRCSGEFALGPAETILDGLASANYHNGGRIAFGPDGMLYVTVGDAGSRDRAQDLDSTSGKILRMTPDGDVPLDNPFPNSFVYSYGHRNSQGIAWTEDGTMYASEFGQDTWDELTGSKPVATTGGPRSKGLRVKTDSSTRSNNGHRMMPAPAESPSTTARSTLPTFVVSDSALCPLADPATADEQFVDVYGRLRDVVVAPDGSLWILTNNTDGRGDPNPGDDRILRVPLR